MTGDDIIPVGAVVQFVDYPFPVIGVVQMYSPYELNPYYVQRQDGERPYIVTVTRREIAVV